MIGDISVKTNLYLVSGYTDMRRSIDGLCATEYSRAVTPQVRQAGNRLSGLTETTCASLLA